MTKIRDFRVIQVVDSQDRILGLMSRKLWNFEFIRIGYTVGTIL